MCNALVDPQTAAAISERVARRLSSLDDSIASYRRSVENLEADKAKVEGKVLALFEAKVKLEAAGFEPRVGYWSDTLEVAIVPSQLTAVYRVLGRLDGKGKAVDLVNPRKKLVRITLTAVAYPFVSVSYQAKLPAGAPCRIEKTKSRARVEHRLVCSA